MSQNLRYERTGSTVRILDGFSGYFSGPVLNLEFHSINNP